MVNSNAVMLWKHLFKKYYICTSVPIYLVVLTDKNYDTMDSKNFECSVRDEVLND